MHPKLHVESFALGQWMTNCYVLHVEGAGKCWIVDAGFEPGPLVDYVKSHGLEPERVILTHGHLDHIAGLHEVRGVWPEVPIVIHELERLFLTDAWLNLSAAIDEPVIAPEATGTIGEGDRLELDGLAFEVRHTPGHSPGGITLFQSDTRVALVGDTLFAGSVGRTDFPTSDPRELVRSIRGKLYTLPATTRVLPGHGPGTTIGREMKSNPFVRPE